MRRLPLFVLLCLLCVQPAAAVYHPVPMGSLHCNTSSGYPLTEGDSVSVTGIVTVGTGTFSTRTPTSTCRMRPAGSTSSSIGITQTFAMGDSVTVSGTIAQYRGLTEIAPTTMTTHATGQPAARALHDDLLPGRQPVRSRSLTASRRKGC